jgi:LemA protein
MILGLIILIAVIGFYLWFIYNDLVTSKLRIKESWSQIDVQLKRRSDLIPNLIESVKGYAKHEKTLLEDITKARTTLMDAKGIKEKAAANNQLEGTLKSLFAVAENYPQLKANENFLELQKELTDTEDKVAYSRQFYNTSVMEYNTKIIVIPTVFIAKNLGFKEEEFFTTSEEDRKEVKVKFD